MRSFFYKIFVLREKKNRSPKISERKIRVFRRGKFSLYYYIASFFFFFQKSPTPKSLSRNFGVGDFEIFIRKKKGASIPFCYWLAPFRKPTGFFRLDPWSGKIEWRFRRLHKRCFFPEKFVETQIFFYLEKFVFQ